MALMEYEFVRGHQRRHADPATPHAADQRTSPHERPEYVRDRIAEERAHAISRAVTELRAGRHGYAHYLMARSFLRQCRLAGIHLRNGDISPRLTVIDPFLGSPAETDRQLLEHLGYDGGAA